MQESDFEGTLVLEKMAETIATVLQKMGDADGEH